MPNPWDIPPFPIRGDDHQGTTSAGMGRVLTQWEVIEGELAQIYGWLVMQPDEMEALHEYGEPPIFRERITRASGWLRMSIFGGTLTKTPKVNFALL